jgi:hypothetical protein
VRTRISPRQVDVAPPQRERLTDPQTSEHEQRNERPPLAAL